MKRIMLCLLFLPFGAAQRAAAAGIAHITDGDCVALSTAASATPGQEPSLIVLANRGHYDDCSFEVVGNITIDGAGATLSLTSLALGGSDIGVVAGARLTLRNINLGSSAASTSSAKSEAKAPPVQPDFPIVFGTPIENDGSLTLDSVSLSGTGIGVGGATVNPYSLISNTGNLVLRNVSIVGNGSTLVPALIANSGDVDISQSTLALNQFATLLSGGPGTIKIANSILVNSGGSNCSSSDNNLAGEFVSLGGNITNDASCGLNAQGDRVVADAEFLDYGDHGGLVGTLALNYNSPAVRNGIFANCAAIDARGETRGQNGCDAGAYEVGGGAGHLDTSGMTGLYFNAASNGHYISVERLAGDLALVVWNTFDEKGTPAWLYGIGTVTGSAIHVTQVAQNVGGVLHSGGTVSGATPTLWGSFDLTVHDCNSATLDYQSSLPLFGSGSTNLQRLTYVNGLDCSP